MATPSSSAHLEDAIDNNVNYHHNLLAAVWRLSVFSSRSTDVDTPPQYTRFHSSSVPCISLPAYGTVLCRRLRYDPTCIGIAVVLIQRYWQASQHGPSELTAHRLLATALAVAGKLHMDRTHTNASVASASGLSLRELNMLEALLLSEIDFKLFIVASDVSHTSRWLAAAVPTENSTVEPEPATASMTSPDIGSTAVTASSDEMLQMMQSTSNSELPSLPPTYGS